MNVLDFKTEYRPGGKEVDWVLIGAGGEAANMTKTWQRIKDLKPQLPDEEIEPGSAAFDAKYKWDQIEKAYTAWKAGETLPEEGTPLAAWPGLNAEQAAHFKRLGVNTVEGIRDASDGVFSALPFPNSRRLKELAAKFLSGQSAAEKDAEMQALKDQLASLQALMTQDGPVEDGERRRPGRPRKEAA